MVKRIEIVNVHPADGLNNFSDILIGQVGLFNQMTDHGGGIYGGIFYPDKPINLGGEFGVKDKDHPINFLAVIYKEILVSELEITW